jgi:hypothetical protein
MEKLDKVIAALALCSSENYCCPGCPYEDLMECDGRLMKDALEVIEDLKIAVTAAGVLERYRTAFEALVKASTHR